MEGQLIAHYKVLRKVGGGGMGVVDGGGFEDHMMPNLAVAEPVFEEALLANPPGTNKNREI